MHQTPSRQSPKKKTDSTTRKKLFQESHSSSIGDQLEALQLTVNHNSQSLLEVSKKSDIMLTTLGRLARKLAPSVSRQSCSYDNQPKTPCESMPEYLALEKWLQNTKNEATMVDYMSNFIVTNVPDAEVKSARSVLRQFLKNSIAQSFNLDGGGDEGKLAFRSTRMYKVYQSALVLGFGRLHLSQMDHFAFDWLKDAKWRKGGAGKKK